MNALNLQVAILSALLASLATGKVLVLNDSTFSKVVSSKEVVLVNFYAPWCAYSRRLSPHYDYVAQMLRNHKYPVTIAKVNCMQGGGYTCGKYKIKDYPVLKLFKKGVVTHTYTGRRSYSSIVNYMRRNTGPNAQVHGGWGEWTSFSSCSRMRCGGGAGTQTRSRDCNSPAPSNGGQRCPAGMSRERIKCVNGSCVDACKVCRCSRSTKRYGEQRTKKKARGDLTVSCRRVGLISIPKNIPKDVVHLDLSRNSLSSLPPDAFSNLKQLRTLKLSKNRLTTLPHSLFTNMKQLKRIALFQNSLKKLPKGIFDGLTELEGLLLSNNKIETIENDTLKDLTQLKFLSLHTNNIQSLPPHLFTGLDQVTRVQLYNNRLSTIPRSLFAPLNNSLRTLELHNNNFQTLEREMFEEGLRKLERLTLGDNSITKLKAGVLNGLVNLKWLDLKRNLISELPPGLFSSQSAQKMRRIDLSRNPLLCSCQLQKSLRSFSKKYWGTCDGNRQLHSIGRLLSC